MSLKVSFLNKQINLVNFMKINLKIRFYHGLMVINVIKGNGEM